MLVFQQFLQYHGKGEEGIIIKTPLVKGSNSTSFYGHHRGLGAVKSQVSALTVRRKPQQPGVPQPGEHPALIPEEGQQWGESVKKINVFSVDKPRASLCSSRGRLALWGDPTALSPLAIRAVSQKFRDRHAVSIRSSN